MISCSKHAWCSKCQPQISAKISRAMLGNIPWNKGKSKLPGLWSHGEKHGSLTKQWIARTGKGLRGTPGIAKGKEHKKAISLARQRHLENHSSTCRCMPNGKPSSLPKRLAKYLLREFPELIFEKQFGPYRIDVYLPPPYHLAFEADGSYWHGLPGMKKKDKKRDKYLLSNFNLPTIRVQESEIKDWGEL